MSDLRVECEGSQCPAHFVGCANGICQMCGEFVPLDSEGHTIRHWREDIIARIERGDFG